MTAKNRQPATFREKAGAILYLCGIPGIATGALAKRVLGLSKRKGPLGCAIRNELAHRVASQLAIRQIRFVMGNKTAGQRINGCSASKSFHNRGMRYASENFTANWLVEAPNRTKDDPVLLYFHGGGYVLPLDGSQVGFLCDIYNLVNCARLSILILDYSLAPESQYPQQLCEAAHLYESLTDQEECTNIMLLGDSAGGNLVIQLLAHLHHKHPDAVQIRSEVRPNAAVILSPWVNLHPQFTGSYLEFDGVDILDQSFLYRWAGEFCGSLSERETSPWVSPLSAHSSHWEKVFPEQSLLIWGSDEVMRDDFIGWTKNAGLADIIEERDAWHIASIFDRFPETMRRIASVVSQGCAN